MRKSILMLSCSSLLALSACDGMTGTERQVVGGLAGGALGVLTASALGADRSWTVIAGLAGAAAGTLVARNTDTGECAYARGDGTYRIGPCP